MAGAAGQCSSDGTGLQSQRHVSPAVWPSGCAGGYTCAYTHTGRVPEEKVWLRIHTGSESCPGTHSSSLPLHSQGAAGVSSVNRMSGLGS